MLFFLTMQRAGVTPEMIEAMTQTWPKHPKCGRALFLQGLLVLPDQLDAWTPDDQVPQPPNIAQLVNLLFLGDVDPGLHGPGTIIAQGMNVGTQATHGPELAPMLAVNNPFSPGLVGQATEPHGFSEQEGDFDMDDLFRGWTDAESAVERASDAGGPSSTDEASTGNQLDISESVPLSPPAPEVETEEGPRPCTGAFPARVDRRENSRPSAGSDDTVGQFHAFDEEMLSFAGPESAAHPREGSDQNISDPAGMENRHKKQLSEDDFDAGPKRKAAGRLPVSLPNPLGYRDCEAYSASNSLASSVHSGSQLSLLAEAVDTDHSMDGDDAQWPDIFFRPLYRNRGAQRVHFLIPASNIDAVGPDGASASSSEWDHAQFENRPSDLFIRL